jgi:hypothetical protein
MTNETYHDQLARMEALTHLSEDATVTYVKSYNRVDTDCLVGKIVKWHYDRNLIDGSSDKDQTLKLLQELGELSDSVCKGKDVSDDLGDMLVVMLNIMERNNLSIQQCLQKAYSDIKDRKGRMVDGVFIKEEDEV